MSDSDERPRTVIVARAKIIDGNTGNILLMKRSSEDSHEPNTWEYLGGKIDSGEDVIDGLHREVDQEAGIIIELTSPLAFNISYIINAGQYEEHLYVCIFRKARCVGTTFITRSHEHSDAKWVTHEEAFDFDLTEETRAAHIALTD